MSAPRRTNHTDQTKTKKKKDRPMSKWTLDAWDRLRHGFLTRLEDLEGVSAEPRKREGNSELQNRVILQADWRRALMWVELAAPGPRLKEVRENETELVPRTAEQKRRGEEPPFDDPMVGIIVYLTEAEYNRVRRLRRDSKATDADAAEEKEVADDRRVPLVLLISQHHQDIVGPRTQRFTGGHQVSKHLAATLFWYHELQTRGHRLENLVFNVVSGFFVAVEDEDGERLHPQVVTVRSSANWEHRMGNSPAGREAGEFATLESSVHNAMTQVEREDLLAFLFGRWPKGKIRAHEGVDVLPSRDSSRRRIEIIESENDSVKGSKLVSRELRRRQDGQPPRSTAGYRGRSRRYRGSDWEEEDETDGVPHDHPAYIENQELLAEQRHLRAKLRRVTKLIDKAARALHL